MNMKYNNKRNSLNELRFYLAFVVVTIHMAYLADTQLTKEILFFSYPLASRAVDLFFVLSGFLIYMSWDRNKLTKDYSYKRFFRLYPLYSVVVISIPILHYLFFGGDANFRNIIYYLLANLTFMNFLYPVIPGVFEGNNHGIINGALWSLKVEVMFYIALPFVYWFIERAKKPVYIVLFLFLASLIFNCILLMLEKYFLINLGPLYNQLPSKFYLFVLGIALYKYFYFFCTVMKSFIGVTVFALIICLAFFGGGFDFSLSILVCMLALCAGLLNKNFAFFSAKADYSYSIYITHFPIIQFMLAFGVEFNSLLDLAIYLIVQAIVSMLCWKVVEYNSLRIGRDLIRGYKCV